MIVAPLTSGSRPAPFRVATTFAGKSGLLLLEQVRAVDARRLMKKLGQIDRLTLNAALAVLRSLFAE
jgi:mRNA interferase MazF